MDNQIGVTPCPADGFETEAASEAESAPTPFEIGLMNWFTKKQTEIARRQGIRKQNERVRAQFVNAGRREKVLR